jgi:cysteine synthase B
MALAESTTAARIAPSLLEQIGNTPLIRLAKLDAELRGVEIYAKAEFFNPGGSVKDRAGLNMILDGERTGRLTPDRTLLDATSGNTGIAYAMIGALKGYRVKLCLPANASHERKQILKATAPRWCSPIRRRIGRRDSPVPPDLRRESVGVLLSDQYNNAANWRAHYDGTGLEIVEQTSGRSLTLSRAWAPAERSWNLAAAEAGTARSAVHLGAAVVGISRARGLKHMPTAIVPGIYDAASPMIICGLKLRMPTR